MAEYTLLPQRDNLHGVLDPALPPALRVRSGDTVHVTTLEADWRLGRPQGSPLKAPLFPRIKGRDDGHALSGPIYVEGARSGMALKVEIAEIVTENWGWSSVGIGNRDHLNRLGFSGEEDFRVWDLDVHRGICQGPDGMTVPLSPFPGVVAVAPEGEGPVRTHIPGNHGGNLDCRALTAGSTVYLPVFHPGALFSVGDGHGAQGDGESGGTAVECPFRSISLRLSAVDYLIKSPVAHTAEGWMTFGFHEDLTVAAYEALRNMRLLLKRAFEMEETDAMTFCSVGADLRVTQIVNGIRGVHAVVPDRIWDTLGK